MVNGPLRPVSALIAVEFLPLHGRGSELCRYFKFYENSPLIRSEYWENREPGFQACLLA
jgi:hypothetical protein